MPRLRAALDLRPLFLRYSQGELALHLGRRERHEDRLGISDCPEAEGIFWA
ncbi:MAG TPA: hypothetical protein VK540_07470 [Polyangiaceae bacterium]|nr:hypothetical protein [Polyangiaceae bacterium]